MSTNRAEGDAGHMPPRAMPPRAPGNAFLLAQLGAHAAARFAKRLEELDLVPAQAGLLRLIAWGPGQSQQSIARTLGTPPSRLVLLIDGLEDRGLVERRRNPDDRRNHALYLTDEGSRFMAQLGKVGAAHEDEICDGLDGAERAQLNGLLSRLAAEHGLATGVHPGYRGDLSITYSTRRVRSMRQRLATSQVPLRKSKRLRKCRLKRAASTRRTLSAGD